MAVSHTGRRLRVQAEEQIRIWTDDLARGSAKDYAEYKYQVGNIAGMIAALQILEEIEKED